MKIVIDDELRNFLPHPSREEVEQLEASILQDGCRDPLVLWIPQKWKPFDGDQELDWNKPDEECNHNDGEEHFQSRVWFVGDYEITADEWPRILVDGHHRYDICTEHGISFDVFEKEFDTKASAMAWMYENQKGRRNWTPDQASYMRGVVYNLEKKSPSEAGSLKGSSGQNVHSFNTAEKIAEQFGVDERTIRRDSQFAEAVEVLTLKEDLLSGVVSAPKKVIVEAAKPIIEAKKAHDKWEEEVKKAPLAPPPEPPMPTQDEIKKAKAHVSHNSGENEWYTPGEYLASARDVMGTIDLDPASSLEANEVVQADAIFTIDDDGRTKEWHGCVWMNPPYAQPLIREFCEKLSWEFSIGRVQQAIVLVNNATETGWFQDLLVNASAVCFPRGRVKFWAPGRPSATPLQGQAVIYLGKNTEEFTHMFSHFGWCCVASEVAV